jgi:hypothetical protein
MGRTKGPYNAEFPKGSQVRIAPKAVLEGFLRPAWKYHSPLEPPQLDWAGRNATVTSVGYYHGGDELYQLENVPGLWHEQCLESV